MGYTAEIQSLLRYIKGHPDYPPLMPRQVPEPIVRELRLQMIQDILASDEDIDPVEVNDLVGSEERLARELQEYYEKYLAYGGIDLQDLKALLYEDYCYRSERPTWFLRRPQTNVRQGRITNLIEQGVFGRDIEPSAERLAFASDHHLCHYQGDRWMITGLGETFLRLPELEATRFLLALESFLFAETPNTNYSLTDGLLENLLRDGSLTYVQVPDNMWVWDIEPAGLAKRLKNFGLANEETQGEKSIVTIKPLGRLILESVMARDSIYDDLIPIYAREMILGSEASKFTSSADYQRLCGIVEKSPLAGDLRKDILDEIGRLQSAGSTYPSVFTALAPKVEGLLRNLCKRERIELPERTNLNVFVTVLRKQPQEILKTGTLDVIDGLFRHYRNTAEHGHSLPEEPARLMCLLLLNMIEQIHQDYAEYGEKRQFFLT